MDHSRAPMLEALTEFRRRGDVTFGPPGHRQGRGVDPRVLNIMGEGVFASDVLSLNGLDDRRQSQGVLSQAQDLMADAVGAEQAFFSTCGSSLSVKTSMLAVAGPGEKILISRNAHKSVLSGVIIHAPTRCGCTRILTPSTRSLTRPRRRMCAAHSARTPTPRACS